MSLLSPIFLLLLGGTTSLYWLLPARWRHTGLELLTLGFLCVYAPLSAALLLGFALLTIWAGRHAERAGVALGGAAAVIVGVLLYFKWGVRIGATSPGSALVPLGLSYYALRCIHYLIERYKGSLQEHDARAVCAYLFFLPTLLAGPIHRFGDFQRDRRRHRWDGAMLHAGLERILHGYAKIAILGNWLISTKLGSHVAGLEPGPLAEYLECVRYGLNLYLQFSGYSDVAIGFALVLGYRVMENFDNPLLKPSISAFWRAWHISLTSWCRDYIYMLVMARTRQRVAAVLATMIVIGLWHELSLRYLVWGAYHGLGILLWSGFQTLKPRLWSPRSALGRRLLLALSILLTLNFVLLSFVITKEPDLEAALSAYRRIFLWS